MLSGYKTYIVMAAWIVAVLLEGLMGVDVPSFALEDGDMLNNILAALGLGALRHAIK